MTNPGYTSQVLAAYEGEVAGAAYFKALGSIYPGRLDFLERCAALEAATANRLSALVHKYKLRPQSPQDLAERGALDASSETGRDWSELMQHSINSYADYVAQFRALETLGPAEDQSVLEALTAHEVQLIEWMRAETAAAGPA